MIELSAHERGTIVPVRAQPGARKDAVLGERGGALRVAVSAPPERGKANAAIQDVLAEALGVRASQVGLISGETSRDKAVPGRRCHARRDAATARPAPAPGPPRSLGMSRCPICPPRSRSTPWTAKPSGARVRVPGSKSLTNRALIVAALADGASTLTGALDSDDTRVMVESLRRLGIAVEHDPASATIRVPGCGGRIPAAEAELFVANSGTSLRFLTAMVATGQGTYRLDGTPRMRQRPVADLLQALNGLGADATSDLGTGCPPVTVRASGLDGGYAFVKGDVSSQFLSGLLMALPYSRDTTTVEVQGVLVSRPYVAMTTAVMEAFGVRIGNRKDRRFDVRPARYTGRPYAIEPDASAASYFFALAAITGGTVTVEGLGTTSIQGDMAFVDVLEHMGCIVVARPATRRRSSAARCAGWTWT